MMEDEPEEEGGIVEYCGLIVGPVPRKWRFAPWRTGTATRASSFQGLFILLLIIAILVWAYYQDQKAVDRSMLARSGMVKRGESESSPSRIPACD